MRTFTRCCLEKWRTSMAGKAGNLLVLFLLTLVSTLGYSQGGNSFSVDFRQGANDGSFGLGKMEWINGIMQSNNSKTAEGFSTLQRVVFLNLAPTSTGRHVLRIKLETEKNSHHSYDFITSWNQGQAAANALAPGLNYYPPANYGGGNGSFNLNNSSLAYHPDLRACGSAISASAATACASLHEAVTPAVRDLPVSGETNLVVAGDAGLTTTQVIANYEAAFGPRTVRVYVDPASGFTGANGDINNRVTFVGYSAGHIFYDISWTSNSTSVVIEFGAHVASGTDQLNLGLGYGPSRGAADINGGPYHVILDDFSTPGVTTEPNLGNQDNQLQGASIITVPPGCTITGTPATCPGAVSSFSGPTITGVTYAWSFDGAANGALFTGTGASVDGLTATGQNVTVTNGTGNYTVKLVTTLNGTASTDNCTYPVTVTCPTPTIGSPGANATINCPTAPSFTAPTASDACGGTTVQIVSTVTGGTACAVTHTRTWRAVNTCGNFSATVSQTITVVDVTAPTIGSAGANATINCPTAPSFTAPTASDACDGATVRIVSTVTGGTTCAVTHTRTWDAVDNCGNVSGTVSQTITVVDVTAPTIGSAGANATITCPTAPSFTAPTASDACGGATVRIVSTVTGGTSCARTHTRTWDAVDDCGNVSATRSQTITVVDNVAPTIGAAGANATINCPTAPSFTAPTASDACDGATVRIVSTVTGGTNCARTHTRTWDAVDECGNVSATRSQTITVVDVTAPTIGAAGANATINCPTAPSFTAPTASDACGGATVRIVSTVTGGTNCARTHTRTWDAVDDCGNVSATRSQTITVVDVTAPTIGTAGANATINCPTAPSFTAPTASDACGGATVQIVSTVTGGTNCARTHTRTWNAIDDCGNVSATRSQTITVVDVTAPTIGSAGANATIQCTATPVFTAPTASDACGGATVNMILDNSAAGAGGSTIYTRSWSAVDECGNVSATRTQVITKEACPVLYCTYTQGAYGNAGGMGCDGTENTPNMWTTSALITNAINAQGGSIKIGNASGAKSIIITSSAGDVGKVIEYLPGGGGSYVLTNGAQISISNPAFQSAYTVKKGNKWKINNTLLAQTITLSINLGITPGLSGFSLAGATGDGKYLVTKESVTCGSTTARECEYDAITGALTYDPYDNRWIDGDVVAYLTNKTVGGLVALANKALAGDTSGFGAAGISLSSIASAVDAINNAFDECRLFNSWSATEVHCAAIDPNYVAPVVTSTSRTIVTPTAKFTKLNVAAYPNPFTDKVLFTIESPVSGQAQLEVFNMIGQKVTTVYSGRIEANRSQVVEYNVSTQAQQNLMYVLTVGGERVTGKLLNIKR